MIKEIEAAGVGVMRHCNHWQVAQEIMISLYEPLIFNDFAVIAERVNLTSADPVYQSSGVRSIGELKPKYQASYQTHGLNFIEVRSRC